MSDSERLEEIWRYDRLGRHSQATTIEKYLVVEVETFERLGREQSVVLGIDAPYGRGKTWFLDRLSKQLELSHPVARVNAWADDVGDEPLTAFMAAIDDALAPYLSGSRKLRDRMAAAKAAALPVMGKLVSGALIKALTKVAGDEIEDELGTTIEDAVRGAKSTTSKEDGAAAAAMEAALEKLGAEIDSLVDRRGAAMLAAYRQRKHSRELFRQNMRLLIGSIDSSAGPGREPLIVIIDELDRCRPQYAIRMLEEIKHFFEVPGVAFVLGLHGDQLSKSIKAVYGSEFDSEDYLRRFFTRRYELPPSPIVEMVAAIFTEWGIDETKLKFPEIIVEEGYPLTAPRAAGLILSQWGVSPREIASIMDALRLFVAGWEHPEPIEPLALLSLIVQMVRGQPLNFVQNATQKQFSFRGYSVISSNGDSRQSPFTTDQYLSELGSLAWKLLAEIRWENGTADSARNYLVEWLKNEWQLRTNRTPQLPLHQSHLADYIPRVAGLARFIDTVHATET